MVGVATLDTLEAQLKSLTQDNRALNDKMTALTQHTARLGDSHQQRAEIGVNRPPTPYFAVGGPTSEARSAFHDDRDVPSAGAARPSPRGTLPRTPVPASTAALGVSAAGGGGVRSETPPSNACWAFLKGKCSRANCRFVHWAPTDSKVGSTLQVASVGLSDLYDRWRANELPAEDFNVSVKGMLQAFPVLVSFVDSLYELDDVERE